MNIFVAKLNFRTSTDALRLKFEEFGEVSFAKVIMDFETGKSKGYGFVEMPNDSQANEAINALNETDFDGSVIVVKEALPREQRPQKKSFDRDGGSGGGYGGGRDSGGYGGGGRKPFNRGGGGGDDRSRRPRFDRDDY